MSSVHCELSKGAGRHWLRSTSGGWIHCEQMTSGKWGNRADISKEQNLAASEGGEGGGGEEGSRTMDNIHSEIRPLGAKDLKRHGVKGVQSKPKATAEEPKKINEAKNRGFEAEIFQTWNTHKAPTEEISTRKGCPMDDGCSSNENCF